MTSDNVIPRSSVEMRELADGIAFWRRRGWPTDLNNAEYKEWAHENPNGNFTLEWWQQYQRPRLRSWLAARPYSVDELTPHFIECAQNLSLAWKKACAPYLEHDISTVTWTEVEAFPSEVVKIKPLRNPSPVFTSKFCHFLLPRIFPVWDNEAVGGGWRIYSAYFKRVQDEWNSTDPAIRQDLVRTLTEATGQRELFSGYPVVNKIIELRLIGRRHPSIS
jgi:hypothetical protein